MLNGGCRKYNILTPRAKCYECAPSPVPHGKGLARDCLLHPGTAIWTEIAKRPAAPQHFWIELRCVRSDLLQIRRFALQIGRPVRSEHSEHNCAPRHYRWENSWRHDCVLHALTSNIWDRNLLPWGSITKACDILRKDAIYCEPIQDNTTYYELMKTITTRSDISRNHTTSDKAYKLWWTNPTYCDTLQNREIYYKTKRHITDFCEVMRNSMTFIDVTIFLALSLSWVLQTAVVRRTEHTPETVRVWPMIFTNVCSFRSCVEYKCVCVATDVVGTQTCSKSICFVRQRQHTSVWQRTHVSTNIIVFCSCRFQNVMSFENNSYMFSLYEVCS